MTSIFEGQPIKTRLFPTKTRVIWVLGIYIYICIYIYMYKNNLISLLLDQYTETLLFFLSMFMTGEVSMCCFPARISSCFWRENP